VVSRVYGFAARAELHSAHPGLTRVGYLRREAAQSRRVASICTGAFVLAEAGILDGRRATTHWLFTRELQARYPKVRVEEDRISHTMVPCGRRRG